VCSLWAAGPKGSGFPAALHWYFAIVKSVMVNTIFFFFFLFLTTQTVVVVLIFYAFSRHSKRNEYCAKDVPTITDLFAWQRTTRAPPSMDISYNLRYRHHNRQLMRKSTHLNNGFSHIIVCCGGGNVDCVILCYLLQWILVHLWVIFKVRHAYPRLSSTGIRSAMQRQARDDIYRGWGNPRQLWW